MELTILQTQAGVLGYSGLEKHGIGSKVSGKDGHEFWLLGSFSFKICDLSLGKWRFNCLILLHYNFKQAMLMLSN